MHSQFPYTLGVVLDAQASLSRRVQQSNVQSFDFAPDEFHLLAMRPQESTKLKVKKEMVVGESYVFQAEFTPTVAMLLRIRLYGANFTISPEAVTVAALASQVVRATFVIAPQKKGEQALVADFFEVRWEGPKGAKSLVELGIGSKEVPVKVPHGPIPHETLQKYIELGATIFFGSSSILGLLQAYQIVAK